MQKLDSNFKFLFDDLKIGNWNHVTSHYEMSLDQIKTIIPTVNDYHILSNILTFQKVNDEIVWSIFNKENKEKFGGEKIQRMLNTFMNNKSYGRMIKNIVVELDMHGYYLVNSGIPVHTVISICKENDDTRKDVLRLIKVSKINTTCRLKQQKLYVKKLLKLRRYYGQQ